MERDQLALLRQLAQLRADRSAARLARVQGLIAQLEDQALPLRDHRPEASASIPEAVMHDRWDRWRHERLIMLHTQIARLNAAAQPQREAHARDTARKAVLEKLKAGKRR